MPSPKPSVVLVTGSSGFVGSAVIKKFAGQFALVGFDRESSPHPPIDAECICIDITSDQSVEMALARVRVAYGSRIASVIHLAAYFDVTGEPDPRYDAVTVEGTARLLAALQDFDVEQFIFMSTLLVHAPSGHDHRIDEDAPLDARFPYRASKIQTEHEIREQHAGIPVVLLRPAGVYDDDCHNTFLAHQIARIYEMRITAYVYPGDLQAGQPYLHLDDLTDALLRLVQRRKELPPETTLLLAESDVMAFGEIQQTVGRAAHDEDWQTRSIPKPIASSGAWVQDKLLQEDPFIRPYMVEMSSDHYEVDTGRAQQLLDWQPAHSLRRALPKMVESLKADPVAWYQANKLNAARVAAAGVAARRQQQLAQAAETQSDKKKDDAGNAHGPKDGMAHGGMAQQMRNGHFGMLWVHWLNILLGAWLIASPFAFAFGSFDGLGFTDAVLRVTADRGLAEPALRAASLGHSDVASGVLVMLFGALSLSRALAGRSGRTRRLEPGCCSRRWCSGRHPRPPTPTTP